MSLKTLQPPLTSFPVLPRGVYFGLVRDRWFVVVSRNRAFEIVPPVAIAHLPAETEPAEAGRKTTRRILSVSYDEQLSFTRERLLHGEGHEVVAVLSLDAAVKRVDAEDFDLAVLCQTMPEEDRTIVSDHLRKRRGTPVLVLGRSSRHNFERAQHSLDTLEGPAAFLQAVGAILAATSGLRG